jgi:hypothetical protein
VAEPTRPPSNALQSATTPPPPKQEAPDSSSLGMMGMVNIINAISGGSNEPVHTTKRLRQEYYRSVSHICSGKYFHLPWSHIPITFTAADIRQQHYPHNDPLVIRANIGKNTKYYFGNDVGRVLVDNGSSANILAVFFQHGLQKGRLTESGAPAIRLR